MAAPLAEIESVLMFLRSNGLFQSESALRADMADSRRRGDLGYSDYEKFLFPMVPPPPPVRIPTNNRGSEEIQVAGEACTGSSSVASSEDEFVSLGSSTSDICSSEFTNPYGVRSTSPGNSMCSSDEPSQFGTARDYHDFDMQNDHFWYSEKDGGNFVTPSFEGGPAFFGCPTEDKFITTLDVHKQSENNVLDLNNNNNNNPNGGASEMSIDYLDKACHFKGYPGGCVPCDFSMEVGVFYGENFDDDNYLRVNPAGLEDFGLKLAGDISQSDLDFARFKGVDGNKKGNQTNGNEDCDFGVEVSEIDTMLNGINTFESENCNFNDDNGVNEPKDEADDEILDYSAHQDEYEVFDLRIIHRKNRTGFEANKDMPIVLNTVIAGRYYVTEYLGSAAFSKVVQAHDLRTGVDVCLKIIKNDKDFFDQSLDEIKLLKLVNKHDPADERHILRLYDYFYYHEHLFIVCELLRANLYEFQKFNQESGGEAYFTGRRLQVVTRQCLEAIEFLHELGIIHCDLKPENILIKSYRRCEIKVIDLGSSCFLSDNLCSYVQSRSYRAPEVILGLPYDQKIDMWSLGCILAELCSGEVLFPNHGVVTILSRMIGICGPIDLDMLKRGQESNKYFTEEFELYHVNEETNQMELITPEQTSLEDHLGVSDLVFIDFVKSLLEINPQNRPTASEALQHPWLSHIYLSN